MSMEYITEEIVNKLQETIKNKPYICNDSLENEVIKEILETNLTGKQRDIMCMRFGLNGENKKTLEEIGAIYNITRERVRQILMKAYLKLKREYKKRERIAEEPKYLRIFL